MRRKESKTWLLTLISPRKKDTRKINKRLVMCLHLFLLIAKFQRCGSKKKPGGAFERNHCLTAVLQRCTFSFLAGMVTPAPVVTCRWTRAGAEAQKNFAAMKEACVLPARVACLIVYFSLFPIVHGAPFITVYILHKYNLYLITNKSI